MKVKQLTHTENNNALQTFQNSPGLYLLGVKAPNLEALIGSLAEAVVTDPAAANATMLGVLRGMLQYEETLHTMLEQQLGLLSEPASGAGAAGSVSAKLRQLTTDIDTIKTKLDGLTELTQLQSLGNASLITPNDITDIPNVTKSIYVGGAGDIKVNLSGTGTAITFKAVTVGTILPIRSKRVYATDTTATNLIALF